MPKTEMSRFPIHDDPNKRNFRTFIVKIDRNGQTYLPDKPEEFAFAERVGT